MVIRLSVCEEPSTNFSCHNEAKSFCTECGAQLCINHSAAHEKTTCPKLEITGYKDLAGYVPVDVFSSVGNKELS